MPGQYLGKKNIVIVYDKYQGDNGQEKTNWRTIGEVVLFRNEDQTISEVVKLWHIPGASIRIFPVKPKEQAPQGQPAQPPVQQVPTVPQADIPIVNEAGTPPPPVATPTPPPQGDEIDCSQIPF